MKIRVKDEDGVELSTFCRQLKLESSDHKFHETDCANTEGIFHIIHSIPSPKTESFKCWPAKVGYGRVQKIEDPKLATKRTRLLYKLKGYPEDWIEKNELIQPFLSDLKNQVSPVTYTQYCRKILRDGLVSQINTQNRT